MPGLSFDFRVRRFLRVRGGVFGAHRAHDGSHADAGVLVGVKVDIGDIAGAVGGAAGLGHAVAGGGLHCGVEHLPHGAREARGILGVLGYLATIVSGVGLGWMSVTWGWDAVYATILVCAVLGGLVVLMMWKAPAEQVQEA